MTTSPHNSEHLTHPKYRPDIDGLRAIAVLSVVSFHAFPNAINGGFIGVDIFFVISGFLISSIIFSSLEKNSFSFVEFYSRRIKRIFPALLLVLVASYILGWFVLLADEYKQLGKHIAGGAGFISNFIFWNESSYFDNAAETKPLLHLWSLGIEEQFYIVWPLLLCFAWKQQLNLLTITLIVAVISFTLNSVNVDSDAVATFYSPQTRFWELLVGSILAYITLYKQNMFSNFKQKFDTGIDVWLGPIIYAQAPERNGVTRLNLQSLLGILLIVVGILVITKEKHFPGWWAVLPTSGAVLIISAGRHAWLNRTVLSNRILVWFGLISFPLYLWHWPLLSFARIIEGGKPTQGIRFTAIVIAMMLAWLTYKLIEKPIRFGNHSKLKTITLLVLMIVTGYVGYNCYKEDGFGFRFPKIVQDLTQYKYTPTISHCFLGIGQGTNLFKTLEACKPQFDNNKKSLLLWGDSHAAHLYAGYKTTFEEQFNILERTSAGCPPILNMEIGDRPQECKQINDYMFEFIKNEKPSKIVLNARWNLYDWKQIEGTIIQLQKLGITDIDLIGPVPQWIDSLPKQLYLKFKSDSLHQLPKRMAFGLSQDSIQIDPLLFKLATQLGVNYISPVKILCDGAGCITRLGDTSDTLIVYDNGHLTEIGSRFLVSQFPKN